MNRRLVRLSYCLFETEDGCLQHSLFPLSFKRHVSDWLKCKTSTQPTAPGSHRFLMKQSLVQEAAFYQATQWQIKQRKLSAKELLSLTLSQPESITIMSQNVVERMIDDFLHILRTLTLFGTPHWCRENKKKKLQTGSNLKRHRLQEAIVPQQPRTQTLWTKRSVE